MYPTVLGKICKRNIRRLKSRGDYSYWFSTRANTTEIKVAEAKLAVAEGASDVDMVINIGALKSEDYDTVLKDIQAVVDAVTGKQS